MERLRRHHTIVLLRILLSIVLFSGFFVLSMIVALAAASQDLRVPMAALVVGAFLVMPRRVQPEFRDDELAHEEAQAFDERFRRMAVWVTWTRLIMVLVAIFAMVALPKLI